MKIAFLVWQFPVLSEPFILNQITGLIERGHEVDIYSCAVDSPALTINKIHPDVEKYQLMQRAYYAPKRPKNYWLSWLKVFSIIGANLVKNPQFSWQLLLIVLANNSQAHKLFYRAIPFSKQSRYDIIHCQFGTLGMVGLALKEAGIIQGKLITTFRGIDISRYIAEKGEDAYQPLFEKGDFFLANCDFFRQKALSIACNPSKIVVHGSGIDCQKFTFKPRSLNPREIVRIATTGRLVEKKGISYCIQAISQLVSDYPNLEYNIIGDGELRTELEDLIQRLNLSKFVKILGWKNQQEIIEILHQSHLFLAPSITAEDGNQDAPVNTLKEAMAMGLPVISTYHGGIPELVEDGVSGFLVAEKNVEAITEKLRYLITHPQRWKTMGKAGREKVLANYDKGKLNDELVQIYQNILADKTNLFEDIYKENMIHFCLPFKGEKLSKSPLSRGI